MPVVVVVGHVDHGKSTLLGRLLADTGHLRQDKIDHIQKVCDSKGLGLEPAFFLDALEEEQAQGISIDTTSVNVDFHGHRMSLIDAPGHIDFLKNMASGASNAEYGLLVIDIQEGIRAQTRRHLQVLSILGINDVVVVVNKMDLVKYDQEAFDSLASQARELIVNENVNCVAVVPICAFSGENLVERSTNMSWYTGQPLLNLLGDLCSRTSAIDEQNAAPVRMVLQDVYKFDEHRYLAVRVVSGKIEPGTEVFFSPSGKMSTVASVKSFPTGALLEASRGASVGLELSEQLFVERGEVISLPDQLPEVDTRLSARIVWLYDAPFDPNSTYLVKLGSKQTNCRLELSQPSAGDQGAVSSALIKGDFADVIIRCAAPIAFDKTLRKSALNQLVICSQYETVAAGVIDNRRRQSAKCITIDKNIHAETGYVERTQKEARQEHRAAVLWLTGLSGSGKSCLARALEHRLYRDGCNVAVLDADNMRLGLCADLGFTPEQRAENVRRLACVAKLMLDNGFICIVAAISPYERDRELANAIVGSDDFSEVFVFCPLELCQQRDPKGLYKRVALGQIEMFTGFDLPYQPPQKPALRVDSSLLTVDQEVDQIIDILLGKGVIPSNQTT